jgi:hypothetical protein
VVIPAPRASSAAAPATGAIVQGGGGYETQGMIPTSVIRYHIERAEKALEEGKKKAALPHRSQKSSRPVSVPTGRSCRRHLLPSAHSCRPRSGVHRLEDAEVPVEFVAGRVIPNGPAGSDLDRARAGLTHDAIGTPKKLHQIPDEIGVAQLNRCHSRSFAPKLPQAGSLSHCHLSAGEVKSRAISVTAARSRLEAR